MGAAARGGWSGPRADVGRGEPNPGADVGGVSPAGGYPGAAGAAHRVVAVNRQPPAALTECFFNAILRATPPAACAMDDDDFVESMILSGGVSESQAHQRSGRAAIRTLEAKLGVVD